MTELDQLIKKAYQSEGKQEEVNQVYLTLLRTSLFIPTKKLSPAEKGEETFIPLFAKIEDRYFMAVFDTLTRLQEWAGDQWSEIDYVTLSGRDVIAGIKENIYLCLNVGCEFYKEFAPDEVKRLKTVVSRVDQIMRKE